MAGCVYRMPTAGAGGQGRWQRRLKDMAPCGGAMAGSDRTTGRSLLSEKDPFHSTEEADHLHRLLLHRFDRGAGHDRFRRTSARDRPSLVRQDQLIA
jgi:hypothetical protein